MKKGKLIVIDGTDCSGKQTQTERLIERLNSEGIVTRTMSFPRYDTPTGKIVGGPYLGKPEISPCWFPEGANAVPPRVACHFYAADRLYHLPEMREILGRGENLVLDRFVEANMGHQGGKAADSESRRKIVEYIDGLEYGLNELPRPDLVMLLYMPYQVGMELKKGRAGAADGHESNPEHLRNAERAYLEIAGWRNWQIINCAPSGKFESLRSKEDIHQEVYKHAISVINS